MKKKFLKKMEVLKKVMMAVALSLSTFLLTNPITAYASSPDVSTALKPLNVLKVLLLAIIGVFGVIKCAFAILAISRSIDQKDTNGQSDAMRQLAAGGIMLVADTILGFLIM